MRRREDPCRCYASEDRDDFADRHDPEDREPNDFRRRDRDLRDHEQHLAATAKEDIEPHPSETHDDS